MDPIFVGCCYCSIMGKDIQCYFEKQICFKNQPFRLLRVDYSILLHPITFIIIFFRLFWIKSLLSPENLTRKEAKLDLFCKLATTLPKTVAYKNKTSFNFFSTLCFIASIKNIEQNKRENIYSFGFTKPALKFCVPN